MAHRSGEVDPRGFYPAWHSIEPERGRNRHAGRSRHLAHGECHRGGVFGHAERGRNEVAGEGEGDEYDELTRRMEDGALMIRPLGSTPGTARAEFRPLRQ